MRRIASIYAELDVLARKRLPFDDLQKKSEPLKRELAELNRKLWGDAPPRKK
jgi:hypothetical protein